ncbi:MAG: hypothetical protein HYR88_17940 [Verrucomicrobia bacterium]|nr:hypothetical protein [Verrucomicrobiota bacterium]MBI3868810.1 hypothetical protein [Verrucomicrobiota bacterium]
MRNLVEGATLKMLGLLHSTLFKQWAWGANSPEQLEELVKGIMKIESCANLVREDGWKIIRQQTLERVQVNTQERPWTLTN